MTPQHRVARRGFPPGPGRLSSLRRLDQLFVDPVPWFGRLQAEYGDIVGLRAGPVSVVVAYDPDIIERLLVRQAQQVRKGAAVRATSVVLGNGLVTVDGEEHRRNRRIAAPVFSPRNVEVFVPSMLAHARELVSTWPTDGLVESATDARDLSLRVAASSIFGTAFDDGERAALHAAMHELDDGYRMVTMPGGVTAVRRGLTPRGRRMRSAGEDVDEIVEALVTGRRRASDVAQLGDLLSRLLNARDDDGSSFDDVQLRDEAVTMLLAGHDTTAAALGWCLVALGRHPDVQARVHAELVEQLGDRDPTAAELRELPVLRAFVDEVMRLYPTGYSTAREPLEPLDLGDGIVLRPGTDVIVPFGWLLRDPRWWTDPLEFNIDRFLPGGEAATGGTASSDRPRVAYIPFGLGPRVCIGASYAVQLLTTTLAMIVRSHELTLDATLDVPPHTGFIRSPAGAVPMHVRRRSDAT
jgi:cytochrome P450